MSSDQDISALVNEQEIKESLEFLTLEIEKLIKKGSNTQYQGGYKKLIENCNQYIKSSKTDFTISYDCKNELFQSTLVLCKLVKNLKILRNKGIEYSSQLKHMNSGEIIYGKREEPNNDDYFKDFGFEIDIAAYLAYKGLKVNLPQNDTNQNDVIYNNIAIECKHPQSLNQLNKWLSKFQNNLIKNKKYGFLAIGFDDYLKIEGPIQSEQRSIIESKIKSIIDKHIIDEKYNRILGICTLHTSFDGKILSTVSNATLWVRYDPEIPLKECLDSQEIYHVFQNKVINIAFISNKNVKYIQFNPYVAF